MTKLTSDWWTLRVDLIDDTAGSHFVDAINLIASQYLITQEISPAGKLHYHANILTRKCESDIRKLCFSESVKKIKMAKYVKKIVSEEDLQDLDQYVCKGAEEGPGPTIIAKSLIKYTTEKIKEFHTEYWRINKLVKRFTKKREKSFIEQIAIDLWYIRKDYSCQSIPDRRVVMGAVLSKLRDKGKGFDSIIIRRLMNGVLNLLDPIGMAMYMESLVFDPTELSG